MTSRSVAALIAAVFAPISALACSDDAASDKGDAGVVLDAGAAGLDVSAPAAEGGVHDASASPDTSDASGPHVDASAETGAPPPTYTNPVLIKDFPDPFVIKVADGYVAFATNGNGKNIQIATSNDLAHWSLGPDALPVLPAWAKSNAGLTWAPSVLKRGTSYVLYYTARDSASGFQCVSRATSTSPTGPFVDTSAAPFVCQVSGATSYCGSIDASPFVDSDGTAYLVWKSDENAAACHAPPRLWSAALSSDGLSLAGPATELLAMDQMWEQPIIEGPSMAQIAGVYYLVYSANNYESAAYSMGYATCLAPTGPCVKRTIDGPFAKSAGDALGPGGGEFFEDANGAGWLAYHAWTAPSTTYSSGGARSLRIDPIGVKSGALVFTGPTTTAQMIP